MHHRGDTHDEDPHSELLISIDDDDDLATKSPSTKRGLHSNKTVIQGATGKLPNFDILGWIKWLIWWEQVDNIKRFNTLPSSSLESKHLMPLRPELECKRCTDQLELAWAELQAGVNLRWYESRIDPLWSALIRAFGRKYLMAGLFLLPLYLTEFAVPWILQRLLASKQADVVQLTHILGWVLLMGALKLLHPILENTFVQWVQLQGFGAMSALTGAIYRKILRLSNKSRQTFTTGELNNLISNDVFKVQIIRWWLHQIFWAAPLKLILAIVFLFWNLGAPALVTIVILMISAPINAYLSKKVDACWDQKSEITDKRVSLVTEMINAIRVIKSFAWEKRFVQNIQDVRSAEEKNINERTILDGRIDFLWGATPLAISSAIFITYSLLGSDLTPAQAWSTMTLVDLLSWPLFAIPSGITKLIEANKSCERIGDFLKKEEIATPDFSTSNPDEKEKFAVSIKNATFRWGETTTLKDINMTCERGKFIAIIGKVGSGKSSLLHAILREIEKTSGTVEVNGTVAYSAQQTWLRNETVRENIMFDSPMNATRMGAAIKSSSLRKDLELLPKGDLTLIGEKGVNLSGGQKQRVSLARTLYANTDIVLLDDPLSAVDAHVGAKILKSFILGELAEKTRILATHNLDCLPFTDYIYVMDEGQIIERGTYAELKMSNTHFNRLTTEFASDSTHGAQKLAPTPHPHISGDREQLRKSLKRSTLTSSGLELDSDSEMPGEMELEERDEDITWRVHMDYFGALENSPWLVAMALGFAMIEITQATSDLWVGIWTSDVEHTNGTNYYITIFATLIVIKSVLTLTTNTSFGFAAARIASNFHRRMLDAVAHSPISFFDDTPSGRIINRFSSDQGKFDDDLGWVYREVISKIFVFLRLIFVIVSIGDLVIVLIFLPSLFLHYHLSNFYNRSATEIEKLLHILQSPLMTWFSETLAGVTTIRAFGMQASHIAHNEMNNDKTTRARWNMTQMEKWQSVMIQLIGIVVSLPVLFWVMSSTKISASYAGLIFFYINIATSETGWFMEMVNSLGARLNAIIRAKKYSELPSEHYTPEKAVTLVDTHWPPRGAIVFENAQLRYGPLEPLVLKGVSFSITAGHTVGIVGRTGAGKSTLISTLFRLMELSNGRILLDDVDIATVPLETLRGRLALIPQDPILFAGTVRQNLDPFGEFTDPQLWQALEACELREIVSGLDGQLGYEIKENGGNFSVGQRQLFCLARAVLRKVANTQSERSFVLVMDEVTSNIDLKTDAILQRTIRTQFRNSTILIIAHRLHTIIDCNKVLVLDKGNLAQFDHPYKLLLDKSGIFYNMVMDTNNFDLLFQKAKEHYQI